MMNKAIFIDKDGTLIKNVPYNIDPSLIELQPFAGEALKRLQDEGYKVIVVSNQSGVARGFFDEEELEAVKQELIRLLEDAGVVLNDFYYCPHLPEAEGAVEAYSINCTCRKPKPGLLLKAAQEHTVNIENSWMIGDILNDTEAGNRAGCRTILFDNGGETEWNLNEKRMPGSIVKSMDEIPEIILKDDLRVEKKHYLIAEDAEAPQRAQ